MKSKARQLLLVVANQCWIRPPLIRQNHAVGVGLKTPDGERYHAERREERRDLVNAIAEMCPLHRACVCSIGTGFGGEEWLMSEKGAALEMIEPADVESAFLRRKFAARSAEIHARFYQFADIRQPCDLVYAASLGNWMNDDPLDGIRRDLLEFCGRVLKQDGIAVFLVYGGNHSRYVLDKAPFLRALISSAEARHFCVRLFACYKPDAAVLVISKNWSAALNVTPVLAFASDVLIDNGKIVRLAPVRAIHYFAAAAMASFTLGKNIGRSLADFFVSAGAIRRYR